MSQASSDLGRVTIGEDGGVTFVETGAGVSPGAERLEGVAAFAVITASEPGAVGDYLGSIGSVNPQS